LVRQTLSRWSVNLSWGKSPFAWGIAIQRGIGILGAMAESNLTRRGFLKDAGLLAVPVVAAIPRGTTAAANEPGGRLKVVCVGGHPDDPESGCAGTLSRYAELGHSVSIVYLTRGERGIRDKGLEEAGTIRSAECEKACRIIGARPRFFGQIDGATEVTRAHVEALAKVLSEEQPDVIFAHWPVDTHMDHQVASLLTIRGWMALGERPQLYFFEVNTGSQSQGFLPNTYVDITPVLEKKKEALFAHVSQDGTGIWREHHEIIARWRGREAGVTAAEAFVRLDRNNPKSKLPGI
jgi:LmbE family N-acetylglucosaminyl deacetylase